MIGVLRTLTHSVLGRGEATITVPAFDGALKPNQALESAQTLFQCDAPMDLATDGTNVYLADGKTISRVDEGRPVVVRTFEWPITALAFMPDRRFAVALDGREVRVYADLSAKEPSATFNHHGMHCVNALAPAGDDNALYASEGSLKSDFEDWTLDLMERGRSGRALRLDIESGNVEVLALGLHYAFGAGSMDGAALISESWRHRLISIARDGTRKTILTHLPVYPSRFSPASGGGWWLTAFTARTQLVEFVLREPQYRKRMLAEIDREYWIAPRLSSSNAFKEPMQGAHLKTMGVVKPWAPPRSYGLVIRLDPEGHPIFSLHSRYDGTNHGVVSAIECGKWLYILAKGPRRVLRMAVDGLAREFSV